MLIKDIETREWRDALRTFKLLTLLPDKDVTLTLVAEDKLQLHCQTPNAAFRLVVGGTVEKPGSVVALKDVLDRLTFVGKTLALESGGNQLTLTSGRSKYSVAAVEKSKAVRVPELDCTGSDVYQMPCGTLQHALATTWFGQSDEGGEDVRVIMGKGMLLLEAADAQRCAYCQKKMPTWKDHEVQTFVLKKAVLAGVLKNHEKIKIIAVKVIKDKSIVISGESQQIELPIVAATALYPVRKEIKAHTTRLKNTASATFSTADIKGIADGVTSILRSAEQGRKTPVEMQVRKSQLCIRTADEVAKYTTAVPVEGAKDSEPFKVVNNHFARFIAQAPSAGETGTIKVWEKDLVTLEFVQEFHRVVYAIPQVV